MAGRGRRDGGPLRRRAARREQPSVVPVEPLRPPELEEREAYLVLDAALQAGEVLLSGGGGASDVAASTVAFANACGLAQVDCDITFTSITLTWVRAPDVAPVTSMRLVRQRELDYTRVTEVHNVVDDVVAGRTDLPGARRRIEQLRRSPHPYQRWAVASARALLSAAVVVLFGGGAFVTLVAFVSTVGIDRVTRRLERRSLPMFFTNAVGAFLATAVALALVAAGLGVRPSLVVAGGIILLLPGSTLVGAVQDAITGYYVTANARAAETLLLTAGIVSGVAVALELGGLLGLSADLTDPPQVSVARLPLQVLAAGAAAAAFAAANHAPRRTLPTSWLAGALGWLAFVGATQVGMSPTFASAVAAGVVGAGSYLLARRQKAPPVLYLAAGIIPLLPGLTIYRGMLRLSESDTVGGIVTLANAATLGLALAAGALLGELLARPARRDQPRSGRRGAGPRPAGPWLAGAWLAGARLAGPLRRRRRRDA